MIRIPSTTTTSPLIAALAAAGLALCATASQAQLPGQHPHYLHALTDLRVALWQVQHRRPEDGQVQEDELVVEDEIAAALQTTRRAALADEKDIGFAPPPDANPGAEGRLHLAMDLLRRARADIAMAEDDPAARGLQHLSLLHIDAALHGADRAIVAVRRADDRRE